MLKRVSLIIGAVRLPKTVRHMLVSAGVLLVVLVVGGGIYTWLMDRSGPSLAALPAAHIATDVPLKPSQPSPNAKEGVSVEMITSPVAPGDNASIAVHTNPTSACTIAVVYNDVPSTDSGLIPKTADAYGTVSWAWTVGRATPLGTWPVKVNCTFHSQKGFVQADLVVAKQTS